MFFNSSTTHQNYVTIRISWPRVSGFLQPTRAEVAGDLQSVQHVGRFAHTGNQRYWPCILATAAFWENNIENRPMLADLQQP